MRSASTVSSVYTRAPAHWECRVHCHLQPVIYTEFLSREWRFQCPPHPPGRPGGQPITQETKVSPKVSEKDDMGI